MSNTKGSRQTAKNKKNSQGQNRFGEIINNKRIMLPIVIGLSVCIVALIVLLVLDATGALYGTFSGGNDLDYEYTFDNSLTFRDSEIYETDEYQYRVLADGTAELYYYKNSSTSVTIPSEIGGYKVTVIGTECFWLNTEIVHLTIPEGVIAIGDGAFDGCLTLYNVKLPSTLKIIGINAFRNCLATMTVEYEGDLSQVSVGEGNASLISSIEFGK